ncbi:MAG: hypothetical protein KC501_41010 [Myxococcales bacterium]|nr:hypothetical protein [Myxococcales bacterium]
MIVDIFPKNVQAHHDLSVTNAAEDHPRSGSCWLVGGDAYNPGGSVAYLQVFDAAAADVTLGSTVPVYTQALTALVATPIEPPRPVLCRTALSYAVTATRTGNGAPASACDLSLVYA